MVDEGTVRLSESAKSSDVCAPQMHDAVAADAVPKLLSVFYAEFDAHAGPRIVFQIPEDNTELVTKDMFDSLSAFLIPKADLVDRLVKVELSKLKVMGYPKTIENRRYERNALIFNLCFVVANVSEMDFLYEPVVEKLANSLEAFEMECSFLSDENMRDCMKASMLHVFNQLNRCGRASLVINDRCQVELKVPKHGSLRCRFSPSMAPTLRRPPHLLDVNQCDIVLRKMLPHINGFDTIIKISNLCRVDIGIAMRCLTDAVYDGLICLHPAFQYSSRYAVTPSLLQLYRNSDLQVQFCCQVALNSTVPPRFIDVFRLINSVRPEISIGEWSQRNMVRHHGIDERRLVQSAVCRGYLRKISGYPTLVDGRRGRLSSLLPRFKLTDLDGTKTLEDLAVKAQLSVVCVQQMLAAVPCVTIVWK